MSRTLYLSDLDGTLLNEQAELSETSAALLNEAATLGAHIAIATARTAATAVRLMQGVRLAAPSILMNGVVIQDLERGRIVNLEPLGAVGARRLLALLRGTGTQGLLYTMEADGLNTYYEEPLRAPLRAFCEERRRKYRKRFTEVSALEDAPLGEAIYATLLGSKEELAPATQALEQDRAFTVAHYRDIYAADLWYTEVFSARASKYHAARFLRAYGGYERVVGFGDNLNDLPLLEACDTFYAVGNAHDTVRMRAHGVIGRNTDDAVARWILADVQRMKQEETLA